MNRQTILAAIHRQLRESLAETGEVRPLGEVVGSVADEIRSSRNGRGATGVIPIETVAAFVDGNLSGEESEAVCRAVLVDNSVLAELVSAVRAIGQTAEELDPLPEVLASQLLAMRASLPLEQAELELPAEDELPIADPVHIQSPTIDAERTIRLAMPRSKPKRRRPGPLTAVTAILSIAVAILAIVFVATRDNKQDPDQPDFVRNETDDHGDAVPPLIPEIDDGSEIRIVESDNDTPALEPLPIIDGSPDSDPPAVAATQNDPSRTPDVPAPAIDPVLPTSPSAQANATELSGLRWKKITGILTRQNDSSATSQSRVKTWESVKEGPFAPLGGPNGQVVLQTLPLSRAEAAFESGGGIVLAGDSEMQVSKGDATTSANVHLHHGDLALVDLPAGTLIRLIKAGHPVAELQWQSKASAVLQHAANGLEVHVSGTINVNRQPQTNSSMVIGKNRSVQSIARPQRLPTWVDRPVATINVKQTFLAQIADSRNVMGTINQQLRGLSDRTDANPQTIATLATWQAALAGENVFRLVGHRLPVVRLSALNRVALLPPWDPRYTRTWATIARVAANKQRAQRFKRMCLLSQQQAAPDAATVDAMLGDLTAPDLASRAMSDFLLRRFHANAGRNLPKFDPTWTGQAQTRGVNLWRAHLGRTPNAAALRNQPAAAVQRNQPAAAAQRNQGAAAAGQRNQPAVQRNQPAAGDVDRKR